MLVTYTHPNYFLFNDNRTLGGTSMVKTKKQERKNKMHKYHLDSFFSVAISLKSSTLGSASSTYSVTSLSPNSYFMVVATYTAFSTPKHIKIKLEELEDGEKKEFEAIGLLNLQMFM